MSIQGGYAFPVTSLLVMFRLTQPVRSFNIGKVTPTLPGLARGHTVQKLHRSVRATDSAGAWTSVCDLRVFRCLI